MTDAPQTTAETPTLSDLALDYIARMPASLVNVASHFGMTRRDAQQLLWALEDDSRVRYRSGKWEFIA